MKSTLILIFVALFYINLTETISLEEFITLNGDQKNRLDELRDLVIDVLPHQYMKTDVYLVRFLRETDFNVRAAENLILNTIKWRSENNIDGILKEDFSEFDNEYRGFIEGCDKEGRPIVSLFVGDYDLRKFIIQGKGEKLKRYTDRLYEESVQMVNRMTADGQNVTQVTMIFDMSNFNLATQACARCIPIGLYTLISLQTHFPGYIHQIYVVNTPSYALPIWEIYKNIASPTLRRLLRIYGKNKDQWFEALEKDINPSQLTWKFGGSRFEALDMHDLRVSGKVFRCSDIDDIAEN